MVRRAADSRSKMLVVGFSDTTPAPFVPRDWAPCIEAGCEFVEKRITRNPLCFFAGRNTGKGEANPMSHNLLICVKNFIKTFSINEENIQSSSEVTISIYYLINIAIC